MLPCLMIFFWSHILIWKCQKYSLNRGTLIPATTIYQTKCTFTVLSVLFLFFGCFPMILDYSLVERFFQFLMLNISSIKELLHKPLEIQWNIIGTLPRKLKRKILGLCPTRYNPLKSQKHEKLLFVGVLWGPGNQCEIQWFLMILWISESFSLNLLVELCFFTYFEYNSGGIIRKDILPSDYHSARWYWCKKDHENL